MRGSRIIVPAELRERVLQNAHEGHPGITKMKDRLRHKVWWPKIDHQAEFVVRSCDACQKVSKTITLEQTTRRELPDGPWQDLAIDFKSLPDGQNLCVVVDYYSRFVEVEIMRTITALDTIDFLQKLFARYGLPLAIMSDNGPQLIAKELESFLEELGVQHFTSPPYWAQANGEVERQNRSIQKIIQIAYETNKKSWQKTLYEYLLMYRSTPHAVTGKSPAELLFNHPIRDKLPSFSPREWRQDVRDRDHENKARSLLLHRQSPQRT